MKKAMIIVTVIVMLFVNVTMVENVKHFTEITRVADGEIIEDVTVEVGLFRNKEMRYKVGFRNKKNENYGKVNFEGL